MDNTLHKILDLLWKNRINDIVFCNDLGINKSAVTDWKKGKTKSYKKYLPQIAEYFNVSVEYLKTNELKLSEKSNEEINSETLELIHSLSDEELKQVYSYAHFLLQQRDK